MLATLGFVITDFLKLPGDVHNVSPVAAHDAAVASGSMFQILTFIVALEFISVVALKQMYDGSGRIPGDFGFDPLNFYNGKSAEQKAKLQAQELENGRTAMLAFAGIVTQAVVTGKGFPYF
jgi:light-harvesting complex I chlorophyll a/b binding protein 1